MVAPLMAPFVEFSVPVNEPGWGMDAGGLLWTLNEPVVIAMVNGVVAAGGTGADKPTNEPVTSAVASSPAALRRAKDRQPPVASDLELGAGRSTARRGHPHPNSPGASRG